MSTSSTSRLGLIKPNPGTGEPVNVAHLNNAFDKIDSVVGATICTSATRPANPFHGQIIRETDTRAIRIWNATQSTWDTIIITPGISTDWETYTPTWTTNSSPQPVLNDGTCTGKYVRIGNTVTASGRLQPGSTTTYGTGYFIISLPLPAAVGTIGAGIATLYDASAASSRGPASIMLAGTNTIRFFGVTGDVSSTAPFTWATSDQLRWTFTYETSA